MSEAAAQDLESGTVVGQTAAEAAGWFGEATRRRRARVSGDEPAERGPIDYVLLGAVAALLVVGVEMVYSASYVMAENSPQYGSATYFLYWQLAFAAIGVLGLIVAASIDYHWLERLALPGLIVVVALLIAVVASHFGRSAYGAQRWLAIGPLPPIQPSEFAKLALILFLASWLSGRRESVGHLIRGSVPFAVVLGGLATLIMLQPDLGSTFIVVITGISLFFLAGARISHFVGGVAVCAAALGFLATSEPYRMKRLTAFFQAGDDPLGVGWHSLQSSIALGSGGLFGRGLGASRQKFYYLYSAHADSIYAVIGEELGLLGTLLVLGLFVLVAYRGYRIAADAPDSFGTLVAAGVTSWIVFQALTNIAVATSTIPFTGIPLPFISYGGSSLVVSLTGVGLLLGVSRHRARHPARS
jgi:cell division protein FtsW